LLLVLLQTTAAANPFSVVMEKLRIGGIRKVPCPAEVKGMLALDAAKMHSMKEQMLLQMKQHQSRHWKTKIYLLKFSFLEAYYRACPEKLPR
jgi:hypothetical protein